MKQYGYSTITFKDTFNDYTVFKEQYFNSPLFNDNGWIGPSESTFRLISNEFNGSHISMSKSDFYDKFENTLYEHYEKFEFDIKTKKVARLATDLEWSNDQDFIQNVSSAPNTEGSTDSDVLDSLDQQTKMKTKSGFSTILSKKQSANKSYYVKTFLDRFRYLFIKILDPQFTSVWLSNEDGYLEE